MRFGRKKTLASLVSVKIIMGHNLVEWQIDRGRNRWKEMHISREMYTKWWMKKEKRIQQET